MADAATALQELKDKIDELSLDLEGLTIFENNEEDLKSKLCEVFEKHGIKELYFPKSDISAKEQLSEDNPNRSDWGRYHLVLKHQDPIDMILSSLNFPHDLSNLELNKAQRKGIVIDEVTMSDLKIMELVNSIDTAQTESGRRMLEYLVYFPLKDADKIRKRQDAFKEFAENPQIIEGLEKYFRIMAKNERGFVEFAFPKPDGFPARQETFNNARNYLSMIPVVLAHLKNTKSEKLREISDNIEQILSTGEMRKLYETIINQETVEILKLDPSLWSSSINRQLIDELQKLSPILTVLEHGHLTMDLEDGIFKLTPRPANEPIEMGIPINGLTVNLAQLRQKYFNENLVFNLYYTIGFLEALCSIGKLPQSLNTCKVEFPKFIEAKQYFADVCEPADPYLLLNEVNVVRNSYNINGDTRGYVITGPNSGGKTVFGFTLPKLQVLAQIGAPIPAESAKMSVADHIYTLRPALDEEIGEGRYLHLLRRMREIMEDATPRSIISVDDFEGTDPEASYTQSLVLLKKLLKMGAGITMTTQDRRVAVDVETNSCGFYTGIMPVQVAWEEGKNGEIKFLYTVNKGVGQSTGQATARTAKVDEESLDTLLTRRGF